MSITNKIQNWNEVLLQADTKIKQVVDQGTGSYYFEVAKYNNDNSLKCRAINFIKEKTNVDLRFSFLNISKVMFTTRHEKNLEEFIKDYRFDINSGNFAYSNVTVKELDPIKRSNALDEVMARQLPIELPDIEIGGTGTSSLKYIDIKRINEIEKKVARESPLNIDALNHVHTPVHGSNIDLSDKKVAELVNTEFKSMLVKLAKGEVDGHKQAIAVARNSYGRGRTSLTKAFVRKVFEELESSKQVSKQTPLETPKSELDDFQKELVAEYSKPEHKNTVKIVKSKDLGRGR